MSGITTTLAITKPVVTQVISSIVAPTAPRRCGIATLTIDASMAPISVPNVTETVDQPFVHRLARRDGRSDRGCHRAAPFRKKSTTAATASDAARGATPYFSAQKRGPDCAEQSDRERLVGVRAQNLFAMTEAEQRLDTLVKGPRGLVALFPRSVLEHDEQEGSVLFEVPEHSLQETFELLGEGLFRQLRELRIDPVEQLAPAAIEQRLQHGFSIVEVVVEGPHRNPRTRRNLRHRRAVQPLVREDLLRSDQDRFCCLFPKAILQPARRLCRN